MRIIRWDSYTYTTNFRDSLWTAIDITWCTIYLTIRKQESIWNDTDTTLDWVVLQKVNTIHSNPTWWVTIFVLSTTDTDIPAGDYYFDIQVKYADNTKSSAWKWICEILQDITKT